MSSKTMGADESATAEGGEPGEGPAVEIPTTGSVIDDALLLAVREAAVDGVPLVKAVNSPYYAPKVLRRRSDVLPLYPVDDVEAGWIRLVKAGRVVVAVVGRKPGNRMPIVGYKVAPHADAGIFD